MAKKVVPQKKKVVKKNAPAKKAVVKKTVAKKPIPKQKKTEVKTKSQAKTSTTASVNVEKVSRTKGQIALLRGMKDTLPKDEWCWKEMYHTAENLAEAYSYGRIETPVLEDASLFVRSIGKETDVVDKEMYVFEDRDGGKVGLRPEMTASVVRSFITHGMHTMPQPVKFWYWGSMFRHDRPQAGRYREFHQFGCEILGEHEPVVDAELIAVAYNFLRDCGVSAQVHINSIGTKDDRERYTAELLSYLRSKRGYLSELSKKRMLKNPLRVLDSKEPEDQPIIEEAPHILDWLCEDSKKFFMSVLEYLDELDIPYVLNPRLVRGLDYYSDTVFEMYVDTGEEGSQSALGGGGRYNGLVEMMGGAPTPASGFAMGLERVSSAMRKAADGTGEKKFNESRSRIFFAQLGEQSKRRALRIIEDLRRKDIVVHHNLGKSSLKGQMELANKLGATHTLILGQKEVQDGTIIIRDMESGIQEIVDQKKLDNEIRKLLARLALDK